jgi:hypothetical protein
MSYQHEHNYRTHSLYRLAQKVSAQPIDWDNPQLAHLQQEMRVDYTEKMSTDNLIKMVCGIDDFVDWTETLTDILAQPELTPAADTAGRIFDLDNALGQGRR